MKKILLALALSLFSLSASAAQWATYPFGLNQAGYPDKNARQIGFDEPLQVWGYSNSWAVNPVPSPYINDNTVCVLLGSGYNANQHWSVPAGTSITIKREGPPLFSAGSSYTLSVTNGGVTYPLTSNVTAGPFSGADLNLIFYSFTGGNFCLTYHHS